jgi:oligopeptide transport system substrate-binding protein
MQAALRSYRNGELNLVRLSRDTIGWARDNDPTELVVTPVNGSVILVFNMTKGPLKQDIRLREAINLAIDRSVIVSKIDNRGETASYGVVSPTTTNYSPQPMPFKDQPMALRLARARTLVNDAGYSPTQPLKLTIGYPTSDAAKQILTVIRQMVLPIGVELSLENMEWQVFASRVNQRDLDIAFIGIESEEALESYFGAAGNANLSGYQNPGFDALYHAGLVDMDRARRRSEFERAERMIVDDYAFAPIENDSESFLVSSKVKGFVGVQRFPQSRYLSLEN